MSDEEIRELIDSNRQKIDRLKRRRPLLEKSNKALKKIIPALAVLLTLCGLSCFQLELFHIFGIYSLFAFPVDILFLVLASASGINVGEKLAKQRENDFYRYIWQLELETKRYGKCLARREVSFVSAPTYDTKPLEETSEEKGVLEEQCEIISQDISAYTLDNVAVEPEKPRTLIKKL